MARRFAGGTSTDRVVTSLTSHPGDDLYSWSVWYLMDALDATPRRILDKEGSGGGDGVTLYRDNNASHEWGFQLQRATTKGEWRWSQATTGQWMHLSIVYDASLTTNDPTIYVDGVSQSLTETNTPDGAVDVSTNPYYIGNRDRASSFDRCWDGNIAHVAVWHGTLLTANQVQGLANGASPLLLASGLVSYVPLYGIPSGAEPDMAPNPPGGVTVTGTTIPNDSAPTGRPVPRSGWSVAEIQAAAKLVGRSVHYDFANKQVVIESGV